MIRTVKASSIFVSVVAIAVVGCNSILDNQPGTPLATDEAGTLPEPGSMPAQDAAAPSEGTDAGAQEDSAPPPGCAVGQMMCFGSCVSLTDPLYGCGNPSCKPCVSTHGTMACQGRQCVVTTCDKGYADCNANSADACEADLSKATSCGACNAVCGVAASKCTPAGATFQCTNGCTPQAPLACGAECVDPMTSTNHCGGCNTKCPDVANATVACAAAVCTFTCKPQFHACAGKCAATTDPTACGPACTVCPVPAGGVATCVNDVCGGTCPVGKHLCGAKCVGSGAADNDPTACGAACTVCPVPANGTATCASGACGVACAAGFGNCDANPANGCEATFASDPLNCGMCGKSCAGQACVNGVCAAPPPPP